MVTENGIWMSDQSFESGTRIGTAEHMNDKHNMHASISILETMMPGSCFIGAMRWST